jgi:hypothetical protein
MHTEIPDFIQPFKHFASFVIESVLDGNVGICSAEESTIKRWRLWFNSISSQVEGALVSMKADFTGKLDNLLIVSTLLQNIRKSGGGWLKKVMRQLFNSGIYSHTSFAFCHK